MKLGAKLALMLSFSREASECIFMKLGKYLRIPIMNEIFLEFGIEGGRLVLIEDSFPKIQIETAVYPVGFSFGTNMYHQGAIILKDGEIMVYEPYGTYTKKINGAHYDYYEPIRRALADFGPVRKYHSGVGTQTLILRQKEEEYDKFLEDFNKIIQKLRKDNEMELVSQLQRQLSKIDISSESSKLVYVVASMDLVRDRCDNEPFLELYEKYSPFSCVAITIIELYELFAEKKIYNNMLDTWQAIEEVCRVVAPRLVEAVDQTAPCKILRIKVWRCD